MRNNGVADLLRSAELRREEVRNATGNDMVSIRRCAWSRLGAALLPMPAHAVYVLQQTIPVPATSANSLSGAFTSYDISFFDNSAIGGFDYIADRTNAAVDVIKGATGSTPASFAGQIFPTGSSAFAGLPTFSAGTALSGPDGVVVVDRTGQHQVWAGDAPVGGPATVR